MMVLLLTLCSNTYAIYMNTATIRATGNPGTDTTGWVNSLGTKVDNTMLVSASGLQRAWAVFKPNLTLPVGAVIASVDLVFNITNVGSPGSASCKINILPQDASQYAGPTLYNTLDPATPIYLGNWGHVPALFDASLSPVTMSSYLSLPAITVAWIEFAGTDVYTISGETTGALAPYLTVKWYIPCLGAPSGGTATSPVSVICPNTPFTITDAGYTVDTGVTYHWQYNTGAGWVDSGTAINPASFTVSNQSVTTQYRLAVNCVFSGQTTYSNIVTVTENPPTSCFCIPNPGANGCSAGDGINTFVLSGENGSSISDISTGCHANAYDDRFAENIQMMQCVSYSGIITKISNNGQQDNLNIWIDFNDDGFFTPSESVCTATNITSTYPGPNNFTIAIPLTATPGNHRMRVMVGRGVAPASFDPCNAGPVWNFGEVHDYSANILPIINLNTPTIGGNADVCVGSCINLTVSVANAIPGTQYIWTYPPLFTPVITASTTLSICPAAMNNTGNFTVKAFYGCDTTAAQVLPLTVHAQPQATPSSNSPVCSGSTLNLNGTPIDIDISNYEWLGPVGFDQFGQNTTRTNMLTTYAGTYSMIVTNNVGCKDTFTTDVTVFLTPNISLVGTNPSTCVPGNDGKIQINNLITGTHYNIFWSGPVSGNLNDQVATLNSFTISNLPIGTYTVYVTTMTVPSL